VSGGPKRLGDGNIIDVGALGGDDRDQQIEVLNLEVRRLQRALADAKREAERAREDADRALGTLRRQLSPLYRALQAVFGELDAAGVTEAAPGTTATVPDRSTRWDEWKQRLGPACARIIDALLLGGEMNVTALTVACKMSKRTVYEATSKMGRAGLLDRAHGRYSLKA
jgi:DNA-binding transcriptional ArsR family regulator